MISRPLFALIVAFFLILHVPVASAMGNPSQKAEILFKAMGYVRGLDIESAGQLAIIYDSTSGPSKQEAQAIKTSMERSKTTLTIHLVPVQSLANAQEFTVFFIGSGLTEYFDTIKTISQKNSIFTISEDSECARSDCCALAVSFEPSVKIYLNESVLEQTGFDVDSTFRYLAIRI
jgi:hypothetical protein